MVKAKYNKVFEDALGHVIEIKAALKLKKNASPKFLKTRIVALVLKQKVGKEHIIFIPRRKPLLDLTAPGAPLSNVYDELTKQLKDQSKPLIRAGVSAFFKKGIRDLIKHLQFLF